MLKLTSDIQRIRVLLGLKEEANIYLIVILAALIGLFTVVLPDQFFRTANLQSMAFQVPELGILAMAMMVDVDGCGWRNAAEEIHKIDTNAHLKP